MANVESGIWKGFQISDSRFAQMPRDLLDRVSRGAAARAKGVGPLARGLARGVASLSGLAGLKSIVTALLADCFGLGGAVRDQERRPVDLDRWEGEVGVADRRPTRGRRNRKLEIGSAGASSSSGERADRGEENEGSESEMVHDASWSPDEGHCGFPLPCTSARRVPRCAARSAPQQPSPPLRR